MSHSNRLCRLWDWFLSWEPISIGVFVAVASSFFVRTGRWALIALITALVLMLANCIGNWARGREWQSGWSDKADRLSREWDERFQEAVEAEKVSSLETQKTITMLTPQGLVKAEACLNILASRCHHANINWWKDIETGKPIQRNVGELLMLCVSELAEAMEGDRKNLMDDKLPHRKMFEVELADCLIRIFDLAGGMEVDLTGAFVDKMAYNAQRADHKVENRGKPGGKAY